MSRTVRWYHILNLRYNPYWYMHEMKKVRIELHRKYRHKNVVALGKGIDFETEPKTRGWITY